MSALNFRIVQSQSAATHQGRTTEERLREQIDFQDRELSRLRQAALRDGTTGGANMRCLGVAFDWIEENDPVSLLFIDIDGFHKVNEALGRDCGDAVLTAVHAAVERALRWDDVAAREGADRFVALLPLAIKEDAEAVGERIRAAIEKMCFQSTKGRFRLTARVGCSTLQKGDDLNGMLERANAACREGRGAGGNIVFAR
jgi:diguanylate cyclase (GGDEF)-like protein